VTEPLVYDPKSMETGYDPHALFRRLRDEAPVYYNEEQDFYALSPLRRRRARPRRADTFISSRGVTLDLLKADVEFPPGTVIFEDRRPTRSTGPCCHGCSPPARWLASSPRSGACAPSSSTRWSAPVASTSHRPRGDHADEGRRHADRIPDEDAEAIRDHFDSFRNERRRTRTATTSSTARSSPSTSTGGPPTPATT